MHQISEATAIRLFNSVVISDQNNGVTSSLGPPIPTNEDHASLSGGNSSNEFGNYCRICRWNRSDMEISRCPCLCRGSVGYIHLPCLKRWILHRRDNKCEICNTPFHIPDEKFNIRRMLRTFCCYRCCGAISKHLAFTASLLPMAHVILQQVLICMENINQGPQEQLSVQEVVVASCALLTSSALFFHYFEFITTRFLIIRNIFRQWWMFGNTNDFNMVELESDITEIY